MRKLTLATTILGLSLLGTACSSDEAPNGGVPDGPTNGVVTPTKPLTPDSQMKSWIDGQVASGLATFQLLDQDEENVVFAPYSFNTLLALLANGADSHNERLILDYLNTSGVETLNEYNAAIHSNFPHLDKEVTMLPFNSIWYDASKTNEVALAPSFKEAVSGKYGAELFFKPASGLVADVNNWASGKTNGLVPQLLDPAEEAGFDAAVLNAFYFSGAWSEIFDAALTTERAFHNADGTLSSVAMLTGADMTARYSATKEATSIVLPLGDGHFTVTFVVPSDTQNLEGFIATLTPEKLKSLQKGFGAKVDVTIPKFDLASSLDVEETMAKAGLGDLFKAGDWSKMGLQTARVSKMLQRTAFSIDEKGGTGAGVSAGFLELVAPGPDAPTESYTFTADKPFLFIVTEEACSLPILMGAVHHF